MYKKKDKESLTPMQAYSQALRFLGPRFLSCQELRQKLQRKQVEASVIDDIERKLIALDYLNDERLAEQVLRLYMTEAKYGVLYIRNKMRLRGLSVPQKIDEYDELVIALRISSKKFKNFLCGNDDYEALCEGESNLVDAEGKRQKVIRFLKNRGFSPHTIATVIEELKFK